MNRTSRSESDVFADISALASSPGYAHAIAQICYRDNLVLYRGEMKPQDLEKLFGRERLIRTEITTLLGLMACGQLDLELPPRGKIEEYVERTDRLMKELHDALTEPMKDAVLSAIKSDTNSADIWRGKLLREPMFYGGESAFSFQYCDLVTDKHGADNAWLIQHKGFSVFQGRAIARAMCDLIDEKAGDAFSAAKRNKLAPQSWLPTFELSPDEISHRSGVSISETNAFISAFSLQGHNESFKSLGDFNAVVAAPLFRTSRKTVLLFQHYAIYEALYESPFYWMMADKAYADTASKHRGQFTERYTAARLISVFGTKNVYRNVNILEKKGAVVGEIDVLVVFGNRLIVAQAKAKKLTLEARRGNDGQLQKDFSAAIQDSYDQGASCAKAIIKGSCELVNSDGSTIHLPHPPKEIFIFTVVSEHYPALAFQSRQFLKYETTDVILPPFVMDVFLIDTLAEMLSTPLRFLSYIKMRVGLIDRVTLSHELTALGYHLRNNLWVDSDFDMVLLDDAIAIELDTAMTVRRLNIPGERTPSGILTRFSGTLYERLIDQLEQRADPQALELGFELLAMSEDSCRNVHHGLEAITLRSRADGIRHDFTLAREECGICFHCNPSMSDREMTALKVHCESRKYKQQTRRWLGVSIDTSANVQFGIALDSEWKQSDDWDEATREMKSGTPASLMAQLSRDARKKKIGRNDLCTCGSGKKYKRCCLNLQ